MSCETAFLSQLVPYDLGDKRNGDLKKGLYEFQALLRASLEAFLAWQHGQLEKFDSLVGENACEIRAIWFTLLPKAQKSNLNCHIESSISKIDDLLASKMIACLMSRGESLESLLKRESLDIALFSEEMFIIQSYLLAEMKIVKTSKNQIASIYRVEVAEPKNFLRFGDVSLSYARNLLSRLRRSLAILSVQFVRQNAYLFNDPALIKMTDDAFTIEHNNLPCIPMFWTYKTVLQLAQNKNIPFVLHVKFLSKKEEGFSFIDEECLFFKTTNHGYIACQPSTLDLDKPACIVQGIAVIDNWLLTKAQWAHFIKKTGVIDVILAGAADHRQFPNASLDARIEALNDQEFDTYRTFARKNGFSSQDPSTFFIQHVYASRPMRLMQASDMSSLCEKVECSIEQAHHRRERINPRLIASR